MNEENLSLVLKGLILLFFIFLGWKGFKGVSDDIKEMTFDYPKVEVEVTSVNVAGQIKVDTFSLDNIYEDIYVESSRSGYNLVVKYRYPRGFTQKEWIKPATIELIKYREL